MNLQQNPIKRFARWACAFGWLLASLLATAAEPQRGPGVLTRYEPRCTDDVCEAWRAFRTARPFPVQTIAGRAAGDKLVLIFSEPALPRTELARVLRRAFGTDVLALTSYRWRIGVDGWLDDVVLTIKWNGRERAGELLRNAGLRDRLSVVAQRLWATSYGLNIEPIDADFEARARSSAPNLDPRPNELQAWLRDPQQRWRPLDAEGPAAALQVLRAGGGGGYASLNGRLNLLVLPASAIALARSDAAEFAARWRAAFRHFAVASDVVVGASWSGTDALLIVGRQRQVPLDVLPPLRFETFALLADVDARELAQSYERTTPFAGKLRDGDYANADWAPIYLSDPLIDSEFGALLNITDQMLKSWSSAGDIDYLYFDYPLRPRPGQFAFGAEPIASIIRKETGSLQVLFNWNTSGAASISSFGDAQVLVPAATGALPVTYGAELTRGEGVVTGKGTTLLAHENTAYRFFASLRDPNLARVVSYTVLYQALSAYKAERSPANDGQLSSARFQNRPGVMARQASTKVLVDELAVVIDELSKRDAKRRLTDELVRSTLERLQARGELTAQAREQVTVWARESMNERLGDVPERIQRLRAEHAALRDAKAVARLMIDRAEVPRLWRALDAREVQYQNDVKRFNEAVRARTLTVALGKPWRDRLEAQEKMIAGDSAELGAMQAEVSRVREKVVDMLGLIRSIETVRARFVAAAQADPEGWIRTPSMVLSWDTQDTRSVGGHNLSASALRIEVDPGAKAAFLERTPGGKVLKVPPGQAESARANAALLARRIEHEGMDAASVRSLLNNAPRAEARAMAAALQLDNAGPGLGSSVRFAGREAMGDNALRTQMVANFETYGRPAMMVTRDAEGYFIVATREGQRANCCLRVLDFATLRDTVVARQAGGEGEVMLVNFNERQAQALRMNLKGRDDQVMLEAVGGSGGGRPPPDGTVHVLRGDGPDGPRPPGGPGSPGGPRGPEGPGGPGGPDKPSGPGGPGEGLPYLVGLLPERGSPLQAIQASHARRRIESVSARLEGDAAMQDLARLQEQARGPLSQRKLQWDPATQGEPVIFKLSWSEPGSARGEVQSSLIAGVDPTQRALGSKIVAEAINTARAERPQQSMSQFQARVKELVDKHRERKWVWALLNWVEEARVSYLLSQAEMPER